MNQSSVILFKRRLFSLTVYLSLSLMPFIVFGQQSNLTPNTNTPLVSGTFNNLSVQSSSGLIGDQFSSKGNLIDNNVTNSANWTYAVAGSAWIEVKDNNATGTDAFPAGSIAGVVYQNTNINVGSTVTITTYLGNTQQESQTGGNLLQLGILSGASEIGFTTTKNFDRIRISFTTVGIGTISVNYAFVKKFVAGPALICNKNTTMSTPAFPVSIDEANTGTTGVTVGSVDNAENVIDGNINSYATINVTAGLLNSSVALAVKDNLTDYPAGTFVGFDMSSSALLSLSLLGGVEIQTYLNGTLKESKTSNALAVGLGVLPGSGRSIIGFQTTTDVDEVKLIIHSEALSVNLGTTKVYNVVFRSFCEGPALACNEFTNLSLPKFPVYVDQTQSGLINVGLGNSIDSLDNVLDTLQSTAALIHKPTVSGVNEVTLSVKKALSPFSSKTFAGIDLETVGVLGLDALNALTIGLYRNDTLIQSASGNSLVALGVPLINGTGRRTIGLIADTTYNEIRLTVDFGVVGLSLLSDIKVYGVKVKKFCLGNSLACNEPQTVSAPNFPLYIDGQHTGINGGINLGAINNVEGAIDGDTSTYAVINQTAGILSTATFTVGNALETYPANTYAGMDISDTSLLGLDVLNQITIKLLKNGQVVQTATPSTLLVNANPALLTGNNRRIVGIVADTDFDAIELVSEQPVSVNVGSIMIHGVLLEKLCDVPLLCQESSLLQFGHQPVVLNNSRTGILGAVNAGSSVKNPQNVLDADNTKYAQLTTVAGVLSNASLSVVNRLQTYPAGSFAGYIVENSVGILNVGLLNSITLNTYLGGVLQESKSGSQLLDLTLLITVLGPGNYVQNMGFITTKPFDEIQISLGNVASVAATINVFGAFVDTRTASNGMLQCLNTQPDFAVTYAHNPVAGDVSTNDITPAGTTYGTPAANNANPSTSVPQINPDGTYTFSTDTAGKYVFNVPILLDGLEANAYSEPLTITVLNMGSTPNKPVVNDDIASTTGDSLAPTPLTIPVLVNDGIGNIGDTLSAPTVYTSGNRAPSHGTVSVDSLGNVIYTPANNYFGVDTFVYQACAYPSGLCDTAVVRISILRPETPNSTLAVDDYAMTPHNTSLTVNADNGVLANDQDPQGDIQTVVAQTDTVTGKGVLVLAADGSYTFTPDSNFVGEIQFPYEITDNGSPIAASKATLHILVGSVDSLSPNLGLSLQLNPSSIIGAGNLDLMLSVFELNGKATNGTITIIITKSPIYTLNFDDSKTIFMNTTVNNPEWVFDDSNPNFYKLTTNQVINALDLSKIGLSVSVEPGAHNGSTIITGFIQTGSGGEVDDSDNSDEEGIQYFQ